MTLSSEALAYEEFYIGIISSIGCGLIVLTYLLFPNLRKLRYVELVFYVGINDLMSSIGLALGPSPDGSAECWYQGLSSTGNYLSAIFWTNIITYQVYQVVVNEGTVLKRMFYYHCLCWGLPLILTFIPLSTNTYNNPDDEQTWCFVADTSNSPSWSVLFWVIVSFYAWVWLAMLGSLFMIVSIALKLRKLQIVPDVILSTIGKLALYPVIIVVCWTLNTIANLYIFSTGKTYTDMNSSWSLVANLGVAMSTSQGVLNACVFFGMNPLVREHWACLLYDMYFNICCCNCGAELDAAEAEKNEILSDLEAARGSNLSQDPQTKLNTLQNSTALPATVTVPLPNVINRGASIQSNPTTRTNSSLQNARGLKMMMELENQADFVGNASVSSMYVHNNSSLGLTYAATANNNGNNGNNNGTSNGSGAGGNSNSTGARVRSGSEERAYLSSIESTSAPITTLMQGLQRTTSGWWEVARGSSMSFGGSFSGPARASLSGPNSRLNSNSYARDSAATAGTGVSGVSGGTMVEMSGLRPSGSINVVNPLQRKDTYGSSAASSRSTSSAVSTTQSLRK